MVKNTTGGNKAKGFARKNQVKTTNALRVSQDEAEVYAQVVKVLGGSMCHVIDLEGENMFCHIRGKFRGRGKRDNFIETGTWLLVGLRDWEKEPTNGKLKNCDILEVYNDYDKDRLKSTVTTVNWNNFILNDNKKYSISTEMDDGEENAVMFSNDKTEEYAAIIEKQLEEEKEGIKTTTIDMDDDEVDVDDI